MSMSSHAESNSKPIVWISKLRELFEGHPLQSSIESSHEERLRRQILLTFGRYNQEFESQVAAFGGYLRQRIQSDMILKSQAQLLFPNPDYQARRILRRRECKVMFDQNCFVPASTDLDIQVENLEQIADLVELLKKVGLKVQYKRTKQGYDPRSVKVRSVLVTAHDILSGFRASVKVDFVLVIHPALFSLDFDINNLCLILGPNKHFPHVLNAFVL